MSLQVSNVMGGGKVALSFVDGDVIITVHWAFATASPASSLPARHTRCSCALRSTPRCQTVRGKSRSQLR